MKKSRWLDRTLVVNSSYFTICTTEKQFHKVLKHLRVRRKDWPEFVTPYAYATTHFLDNKQDQKKASVVCYANYQDKTPAQIAALLCHEAVHIWQETREDYGERSPSYEFEAYAIQSLAQSLIEEFERQTK